MGESRRVRRLIGVAGLSAVLAVGSLAPAGAHSFTADSAVSLGYGADTFRGDLDSGRDACERSRSVTVFKITQDGDVRRVGTDRTNREGNWTVPTDPQPDHGRYFARARGRSTGGYGHRHRCAGDRSRTINP